MYKCDNCGDFFAEPKIREIQHAEGYGEQFALCPWCGGDDFEEAEACKCCGEYESKLNLEGGLCKKCRDAFALDFWRYVHITAADGYGIDTDTAIELIADLIERYE